MTKLTLVPLSVAEVGFAAVFVNLRHLSLAVDGVMIARDKTLLTDDLTPEERSRSRGSLGKHSRCCRFLVAHWSFVPSDPTAKRVRLKISGSRSHVGHVRLERGEDSPSSWGSNTVVKRWAHFFCAIS